MARTIKSQKGQNNGNYRHGGKHTKLYEVWCSMRHRCNNKTDRAYKHYGARGIKVCNEWNNSFGDFKKWSIANGYCEGLTIDRIDVNGNYAPENCRWIEFSQQCDNKTNTKRITYKGEIKTIKEWSEILHIERMTLYYRIYKLGWNIERAFTEKVSLNRYKRELKAVESK